MLDEFDSDGGIVGSAVKLSRLMLPAVAVVVDIARRIVIVGTSVKESVTRSGFFVVRSVPGVLGLLESTDKIGTS